MDSQLQNHGQTGSNRIIYCLSTIQMLTKVALVGPPVRRVFLLSQCDQRVVSGSQDHARVEAQRLIGKRLYEYDNTSRLIEEYVRMFLRRRACA